MPPQFSQFSNRSHGLISKVDFTQHQYSLFCKSINLLDLKYPLYLSNRSLLNHQCFCFRLLLQMLCGVWEYFPLTWVFCATRFTQAFCIGVFGVTNSTSAVGTISVHFANQSSPALHVQPTATFWVFHLWWWVCWVLVPLRARCFRGLRCLIPLLDFWWYLQASKLSSAEEFKSRLTLLLAWQAVKTPKSLLSKLEQFLWGGVRSYPQKD